MTLVPAARPEFSAVKCTLRSPAAVSGGGVSLFLVGLLFGVSLFLVGLSAVLAFYTAPAWPSSVLLVHYFRLNTLNITLLSLLLLLPLSFILLLHFLC